MPSLFSKTNNIQKRALVLNFLIRIIAPLWLFIDPVIGIIVGLLTDIYDYYLLVRYAKLPNSAYQYQDKILDYYWYILILVYAYFHVNNQLLLSTFIITFVFRTIGQIIYMSNHKDGIFLYFPNVQEPLFWIWVLNRTYFEVYPILPTLLVIVLVKIIVEYYVHIIRVNPLNQFFHYFNIKTNF